MIMRVWSTRVYWKTMILDVPLPPRLPLLLSALLGPDRSWLGLTLQPG